jgi:hypothetical protein
MVQIAIGRRSKLQSAEVNIVECLIVNAERLVRVLHELVDGKGGIIWLFFDNCKTKQNRKLTKYYAPRRRCRRLWDWEQRSTCTSSDRGIPRGFLR